MDFSRPLRPVRIASGLLLGLALAHLTCGPTPILEELATLPPRLVTSTGWHPLWDERLPRLLVVALSGASLGVAGLITQSLFHNPLACPGLLGITAGSTLASTLAITLGGPFFHPTCLAGATLLGSLLCVGLLLFWGQKLSCQQLPLLGIAFSALLLATEQAIEHLHRDNWPLMATLSHLHTASSQDRHWFHVYLGASLIAWGFYVAKGCVDKLDLLSLGPEEAAALGLDPKASRLRPAWAIAFLVTGSTLALGPLPFVGLMIPHVVRPFCSARHRALLPLTALTGAIGPLAVDLFLREGLHSSFALGHAVSILGALFLFKLLVNQGPNGGPVHS